MIDIRNKAIDLDFSGQRFTKSEWPEGSLEWMDKRIIQSVFDIRNRIPQSHSMIPSPLVGAHVRHTISTSQHSTMNRRKLSTATDVFMRWEHVWLAVNEAYRHPDIGGIGIYTDMMLRGTRGDFAMLHLDCRPKSEFIQWVGWREEGMTQVNYTYFHSDPQLFYKILAKRGKYGA